VSSLFVSVPTMMMLPRRSIRPCGISMRPFRSIIRRALLRKLHLSAIIQSIDTVAYDGFTQFKPGKDGCLLSINWPRFDHTN